MPNASFRPYSVISIWTCLATFCVPGVHNKASAQGLPGYSTEQPGSCDCRLPAAGIDFARSTQSTGINGYVSSHPSGMVRRVVDSGGSSYRQVNSPLPGYADVTPRQTYVMPYVKTSAAHSTFGSRLVYLRVLVHCK